MTGFEGPIYVNVKRSRGLLAVTLAAHAIASAVLSMCVAPSTLATSAVVLIGISAGQRYRAAACAKTDDIVGILLTSNDHWQLSLHGGRVIGAELHRIEFMSPWLTVLSFKLDGGANRQLLLCRDNLPADGYRRLRVRLRFRSPLSRRSTFS